jgi:hypothetical protein
MATTTVRSSTQLFIDNDLNVAASGSNKKVIGVANGVNPNDAVNMSQLNALIASADAMVFKGTIGVAGTFTKAAFNALTVYNTGWTYRVIDTDATLVKGKSVETGDLLIALVDRASAGVDADWTVVQTNIDGAVIKADFTAQTILAATTNATPLPLTVGEQTFVGRKTGGNIAALTKAEALVILNVSDGATNNTKTTGAEIDAGTDDVKFATPKALKDSGIISSSGAAEFGVVLNKSVITDGDQFLIEDSAATFVKKYFTWANLKVVLNTFFDTKYWKLTATGDVSISADVTTIGNDKVVTSKILNKNVTFAKIQDIATSIFLGRNTANTGVVEELSVATVKSMLGLNTRNLSSRTYRANFNQAPGAGLVIFDVTANVFSGTEEIFKNGQLLELIADYLITYGATTTVTFVSAPLSAAEAGGYADLLKINYSV